MGWILVSIVSVNMRVSGPEEWPPMFAGPAEACSIRRFWGCAWHQSFRRSVSSHGKAGSAALGLNQGTWASSYTELYIAFFVSGLVHYAADVQALNAWHGGSMYFFLA
ncbi:unnamed protein product [Mycena citricolor]|uniref:Wax synthase domain-containing protein n=1 Tax=Mycena citricolor TaxID=2018698 RepID=A0AAD2K7N3_9AGAR|nr:unnamed protein product [Mycena citricolor]